MEDLNKAIGRAVEVFANLAKAARTTHEEAKEAMWQKKNPYLEYMIALLRGQKEGMQLGDCKIRGPETSEPATAGQSSGSQ